jgi:hypothetical protein
MGWIDESTQKFIQFVLVVVAGTGGLMYWVDKWRERVRLSARLISVDTLLFQFEVENYGKAGASLRWQVLVKGYREDGGRLRRVKQKYEVVSSDRSLPSHEPKRFAASRKLNEVGEPADDNDLLLPRYLFFPTWGSPARLYGVEHSHIFSIRLKNRLPTLSPLAYWLRVLKLKGSLGRKSALHD